MNIGFFTEGNYQGKIPRSNPNMRSDVSWICSLDATHHPINSLHTLSADSYDVGVVIIPKTKNYLINYPFIKNLRRVCKKIAIMQESTYWYWQDNEIEEQIWYFNTILEFDLILCHNDVDLKYYRGLTNKPCELLPTVMIGDNVKTSDKKNESVMIGGNFVSIYRGIDSYMVAREISDDVWAPTTGRMKDQERELDIKHLDWVTWTDFMYELSKHKYAVQLGTPSAGSFNLNCSYLGIPCIGYDNVNTQKVLHPSLSMEEGDIKTAKELANKLKDKDFYNHCSNETKDLYSKNYSEENFLKIWKQKILTKLG
jgi:hypothetical protein|tara:strand:- start:3748 stop:4683 length:936 start_codon:yes stop_codon:yes gene_type:complete